MRRPDAERMSVDRTVRRPVDHDHHVDAAGGDNQVSFTVAANATTTARTGRITVRDKVVLITQAGQ